MGLRLELEYELGIHFEAIGYYLAENEFIEKCQEFIYIMDNSCLLTDQSDASVAKNSHCDVAK